jgi:hypothetical protein
MCVTVLPCIVNESILMPVHLKAKAPNVAIELKLEDLENCLKGMIEQHVESVPAVGSREKLSADILCRLSSIPPALSSRNPPTYISELYLWTSGGSCIPSVVISLSVRPFITMVVPDPGQKLTSTVLIPILHCHT